MKNSDLIALTANYRADMEFKINALIGSDGDLADKLKKLRPRLSRPENDAAYNIRVMANAFLHHIEKVKSRFNEKQLAKDSQIINSALDRLLKEKISTPHQEKDLSEAIEPLQSTGQLPEGERKRPKELTKLWYAGIFLLIYLSLFFLASLPDILSIVINLFRDNKTQNIEYVPEKASPFFHENSNHKTQTTTEPKATVNIPDIKFVQPIEYEMPQQDSLFHMNTIKEYNAERIANGLEPIEETDQQNPFFIDESNSGLPVNPNPQ